MTRVPILTSRDAIRHRKAGGFVFDRQAKGSHEIWYNPSTRRRTVIPNHPGIDLPKGTLLAILKEAGLNLEEFLKL